MFSTRAAAAAAALLLVTWPLAACTSGTVSSSTPEQPMTAPDNSGEQAEPGTSSSDRTGTAQQQAERDVIRTATLSVVVEDPEAAGNTIQQAATAAGGYVAQVTTTPKECVTTPCPADAPTASESGEPSGAVTGLTMTVRVPAARYDAVLEQVRGLGEVAALNVTADDVTAEVVDLDARIQSQRASVARMRQLLQQADTIDEMVRVEGELAQRQADLESMESQRKRLADQVALATITATLVRADQAAALLPEEPHWWDEPWNTFTQSWRGLFVALAAISPLLIMLGIGGAIVLLILRLRGRHADAAIPPAAEPRDDTPPAP